jgi:hypothetical protein
MKEKKNTPEPIRIIKQLNVNLIEGNPWKKSQTLLKKIEDIS